jgi:hypothetical protein
MNLRTAIITQSPSLALQRSAADEIARLDAQLAAARGVIDAWDSAPGISVYRYGPLMDWLTKTMLPAISKLRESMQ